MKLTHAKRQHEFPAKGPVALTEWSTTNGWWSDTVTLSFDSQLKVKVNPSLGDYNGPPSSIYITTSCWGTSLLFSENIPQYS